MRAGGKSQDLVLFPLRPLHADSNMCPDVPGETRAGWLGCGLWEVWGMNLLSSPASRAPICLCRDYNQHSPKNLPQGPCPLPHRVSHGDTGEGTKPCGKAA